VSVLEQREHGDLRPQRRLRHARLEDGVLVVGVRGVEQRHRQRAEVLERSLEARLVGARQRRDSSRKGIGSSFGCARSC
jgi:hypothetical protein